MTRSFAIRSVTALVLLGCGAAPAPLIAERPAAVPPSRASCEALVEHVVDLAWLAYAHDEAEGHGMIGTWGDSYGEDRHEYKKELRVKAGQALAQRCAQATVGRVDCALAAETVEAVTACDAAFAIDRR